MTEAQFKAVTKWQDETFPNATAESKLFHLLEEIKEVHLAIQISEDIDLEFADCLMLLFGAAAKAGLSYEDICNAIDYKMEINKKREWGIPDQNGVVKHLKETNQ